MVRKNRTSKELLPPDDSNLYLDNAKLFFSETTQNKTHLNFSNSKEIFETDPLERIEKRL